MRLFRRLAAVILTAAAGLTCTDAGTGPAGRATANLALQPSFSEGTASTIAALAQLGLEVNNVRIVLVRADGRTALDTVVQVDPAAQELALTLPIVAESADEEFVATLQLRNGTTVLFKSTARVRAGAGRTNGLPDPSYVGPGAQVKRLVLAPQDTTMSTADVLPMRVKGFDANDAEVSALLLGWSVDVAALASVSDAGVLTPSGQRGRVRVTVRTPTGVSANADVELLPPPSRVVVISGGDQQAQVGAALPQPVRLEVRATDGATVPGARVALRVVSGGGSISPAEAVADANGRIEASITLGRVAGSQSFAATVVGTSVEGIFDIVALAAPATGLAIAAGDGQEGFVGTAAFVPFVVRVTNAFGELVPGAVVQWEVEGGTGTLAAGESAAGDDGHARMTYTFGAQPRTDSIVARLPAGSASVRFVVHGRAGPPSAMEAVNGTSFSGVAGTTLGAPYPAVIVRDRLGNPMAGVPVLLSLVTATGEEPRGGISTDAGGRAEVAGYPLSTEAGTIQLVARVQGAADVPPVTFTITVVPDAPARYGVTASTIAPLPGGTITVSAQLQDQYGNAIRQAGRTVQWTSTNGGSLSAATSTTSAEGVATVQFTASSQSGVAHELVATDAANGAMAGSLLVSTQMPQGTRLALTWQHGATLSAGTLFAPATLQLTNAAGEPLAAAGLPVSAELLVPAGAPEVGMPALTGTATVLTDAAGRATFDAMSAVGRVAQGLQVRFSASGVESALSPTFELTPGAVSRLMFRQAPPATATSGVPFSPQPVVALEDAYGNLVPTSGVTVTASSGRADVTLDGATAVTSSGIATFTALAARGPGGASVQVNFTAEGAQVGATVALVGGPSAYAVNASVLNPVQGTSVTITAQLLDEGGVPLAHEGRTVQWSATEGGTFSSATTSTNASGIATVSFTVAGSAGVTHVITAQDAALAGVSGSRSITTRAPQTPATANLISGNAQSGTVNAVLAAPMVVEVRDAQGQPVQGISISWASGGGRLGETGTTSAQSVTDAAGRAQMTYTLPTVAGTATVVAQATGLPAVEFTHTAVAGAPVKLELARAPSSPTTSGTPFATQPIIWVADQYGNASAGGAGYIVTFGVEATGYTLSGNTAVADAAGKAMFSSLTASGPAGSLTLLIGSEPALPVISLAVEITAAPNTMTARDSTSFTGRAGDALTQTPAVVVKDAGGSPVPGAEVTFTRSVDGVPQETWYATTDAAGVAEPTAVYLPTLAGTSTIVATAANVTAPVSFALTVTPNLLNILKIEGGDLQAVPVGGTLPDTLRVRATDWYGNVIAGAPVRWGFWYGSGTFVTAESVTDASGLARATVALPTAGGINVAAEAGDVPPASTMPRVMQPERPRLDYTTVTTRHGPVRVYRGLVSATPPAPRAVAPESQLRTVGTQAFEGGYASAVFTSVSIPAGVQRAWMGDPQAELTNDRDRWNRAANWRSGTGAVAATSPAATDAVFIPVSSWSVGPRLDANVAVGTVVIEGGAQVELGDFRLEVQQGGIRDLTATTGIGYFVSNSAAKAGTVALTTTAGQPVRGLFENLEIGVPAQLTEWTQTYSAARVTDALDLNGFSLYVNGDFTLSGPNAGLLMTSTTAPELYVGGNATFEGRDVGSDWTRGYLVFEGDLTVNGTHSQRAFRGGGPELYTYFSGAQPQTVRGTATWSTSPDLTASSFSELIVNPSSGSAVTFEQAPAITGSLSFYTASTMVLPPSTPLLTLPAYLYMTDGADFANLQTIELAGVDYVDVYGTISPDLLVSGTYSSWGGTFARDVTITGELRTSSGTLSVGRDLIVSGPEAVLSMTGTSARVVVAGRAHFDGKPAAGGISFLQYGTLELRGDLQVDATHGGPDAPAFRPRNGSFSTVFSGAGAQRVFGAGNWSVIDQAANAFQHVSVEKPAGTTLTLGGAGNALMPAAIDGDLHVASGRVEILDPAQPLGVSGNVTSNAGSDLGGVAVLTTDGAPGARSWPQIAGTWPARFQVGEGHIITLDRASGANADVWIYGTINTNGNALSVSGGLELMGGTGRLRLNGATSVVTVGGDAGFAGADASAQEDFTAGRMEFKGNVAVDETKSRALFAAGAGAEMHFIGSSAQVLDMNADATAAAPSRLGTVVVNAGSDLRIVRRAYTPFQFHQKGKLTVDEASILTVGDPQVPAGELVLYENSTTEEMPSVTAAPGQIVVNGTCRTEPATTTTFGSYSCPPVGRIVERMAARSGAPARIADPRQ